MPYKTQKKVFTFHLTLSMTLMTPFSHDIIALSMPRASMRTRELPVLQQLLTLWQRHRVRSLERQHDVLDLILQFAVKEVAAGAF